MATDVKRGQKRKVPILKAVVEWDDSTTSILEVAKAGFSAPIHNLVPGLKTSALWYGERCDCSIYYIGDDDNEIKLAEKRLIALLMERLRSAPVPASAQESASTSGVSSSHGGSSRPKRAVQNKDKGMEALDLDDETFHIVMGESVGPSSLAQTQRKGLLESKKKVEKTKNLTLLEISKELNQVENIYGEGPELGSNSAEEDDVAEIPKDAINLPSTSNAQKPPSALNAATTAGGTKQTPGANQEAVEKTVKSVVEKEDIGGFGTLSLRPLDNDKAVQTDLCFCGELSRIAQDSTVASSLARVSVLLQDMQLAQSSQTPAAQTPAARTPTTQTPTTPKNPSTKLGMAPLEPTEASFLPLNMDDALCELVLKSDVWIGRTTKYALNLDADRDPKKMTFLLLENYFTDEDMAKMSARGKFGKSCLALKLENAMKSFIKFHYDSKRYSYDSTLFNSWVNTKFTIARRRFYRKHPDLMPVPDPSKKRVVKEKKDCSDKEKNPRKAVRKSPRKHPSSSHSVEKSKQSSPQHHRKTHQSTATTKSKTRSGKEGVKKISKHLFEESDRDSLEELPEKASFKKRKEKVRSSKEGAKKIVSRDLSPESDVEMEDRMDTASHKERKEKRRGGKEGRSKAVKHVSEESGGESSEEKAVSVSSSLSEEERVVKKKKY